MALVVCDGTCDEEDSRAHKGSAVVVSVLLSPLLLGQGWVRGSNGAEGSHLDI